MNNNQETTMIYLAGDMLKKGSQLLRQQEKESLELIPGAKVYAPQDDKEINDKQNQTEESNNGLAEKIVLKDTKGIMESEIVVIEPTNDARGTMVELGQIKGMRDAFSGIFAWLSARDDVSIDLLVDMLNELHGKYCKIVLPHYEDVRRTDIPESSDRRSWSVNQYVYGVCLDLTHGKGFYEWDEILKTVEDYIYEQ